MLENDLIRLASFLVLGLEESKLGSTARTVPYVGIISIQ